MEILQDNGTGKEMKAVFLERIGERLVNVQALLFVSIQRPAVSIVTD